MFPVHFHSWGAGRHARNGDPEKVVTFAHRNDLLGGHVTFNKLSIDHCCVAGRDVRRDPRALLQRRAIGIIDDAHLAPELPLRGAMRGACAERRLRGASWPEAEPRLARARLAELMPQVGVHDALAFGGV